MLRLGNQTRSTRLRSPQACTSAAKQRPWRLRGRRPAAGSPASESRRGRTSIGVDAVAGFTRHRPSQSRLRMGPQPRVPARCEREDPASAGAFPLIDSSQTSENLFDDLLPALIRGTGPSSRRPAVDGPASSGVHRGDSRVRDICAARDSADPEYGALRRGLALGCTEHPRGRAPQARSRPWRRRASPQSCDRTPRPGRSGREPRRAHSLRHGLDLNHG
jgi:hypothetical protein